MNVKAWFKSIGLTKESSMSQEEKDKMWGVVSVEPPSGGGTEIPVEGRVGISAVVTRADGSQEHYDLGGGQLEDGTYTPDEEEG